MGKIPHCVEDSEGEQKLPRTILRRNLDLGLLNTTDLPLHLFRRYQQVIFEKRDTDIFAHARLERLITELSPTTFIVCGAGQSQGIAQASSDLRNRDSRRRRRRRDPELRDRLADMAKLRMQAQGRNFRPTRRS
jgi:hypothetical protein